MFYFEQNVRNFTWCRLPFCGDADKCQGWGCAMAQTVSRWLPTAAARVRDRVRSCWICGGQSGTGAGFFRVLRFPLSIFIPPIAPQSPSSIIWGWYERPTVVAVPSGLSLIPLRTKKEPGVLIMCPKLKQSTHMTQSRIQTITSPRSVLTKW
jgi:hypothetical protein